NRKQIWDSIGLGGGFRSLIRKGRGWTGWLKGDRFEDMISRHLRVKNFEQCPRSLYLTAFNLTRGGDETFFLGTIPGKGRASCSYPFLMSSKIIDGSEYWDGGFLSKIPIETLIEQERPDHVIIHYLPTREDPPNFAERNWSAIALLERALTSARKEIE